MFFFVSSCASSTCRLHDESYSRADALSEAWAPHQKVGGFSISRDCGRKRSAAATAVGSCGLLGWVISSSNVPSLSVGHHLSDL